jgi:hypothetical protein
MIFLSLESIFAFSATDIWLVSSLPIHGDGEKWQIYDVRELADSELSLSKAWGSSSTDMYFVGRAGSIAHFNGSSWTKIESGTELPINDIWGDYNNKTDKWEVLTVASNSSYNEGKELLSITKNSSKTLSSEGLSWSLETLWFKTNRKYIIGGDGLYISNNISRIWKRDTSQPPYYKTFVRGLEINDIYVAGAFGMVLHFNGFTWYNYITETKYNDVGYGAISISDNLVAISGATSTQGIITIGRR